MITTTAPTVYDQVLQVTTDYLGPAAERFITRQIKVHLDKKPSELSPADVAKLADWLKVAIALLTEDNKMVDDFNRDLLKIAKTGHRP